MDDAQNIQSAIELLKISAWLDFMNSIVEVDDKFKEFLITLVRNGCPTQSIMLTFKQIADKSKE